MKCLDGTVGVGFVVDINETEKLYVIVFLKEGSASADLSRLIVKDGYD